MEQKIGSQECDNNCCTDHDIHRQVQGCSPVKLFILPDRDDRYWAIFAGPLFRPIAASRLSRPTDLPRRSGRRYVVECSPAAFERSSAVNRPSMSIELARLRTRLLGRGKSVQSSEQWPDDRSIHLFVHGEGRRPFVGAIGTGGANSFSAGHQLHRKGVVD